MSTRVGYTGGETPSPTYKSVCAGDGHTEALQIEYDPTVIDYEALLNKFWSEHDYSFNYMNQYKSAVWAHNDEQRAIAEEKMRQCGPKGEESPRRSTTKSLGPMRKTTTSNTSQNSGAP